MGKSCLSFFLFFALSSFAQTLSIRDSGKLFSSEGIKIAQALISEIKKTHGVEAIVESFTLVPFSDPEKGPDSPQKDPLFMEWNEKQQRRVGKDKIFIGISEPQGLVLVWVGQQLIDKKLFAEKEKTFITRMMAGHLERRAYDQGLIEGLRTVKLAITGNKNGNPLIREPEPPPPPTPLTLFWKAISYLCVAFILGSFLLHFLKFKIQIKVPTFLKESNA